MYNLELIDLLVKKKSGNITLLEQKRLREIISENRESEALSNIIDHIYSLPVYQNIDDNSLWKAIQSEISELGREVTVSSHRRKQRLIWMKVSAIAASVALIIFLSFYYFYPASSFNQSQNIVATKPGFRSNLILPDGSKVWLNNDSRIAYNDEFSKDKRELTLEGEAYFDVKHDEAHPFIIHLGKADIKVLGTEFNVRNYGEEDLMETSLIRGKIEVTINDEFKNKFYLKPSDKLVISKSKISAGSGGVKSFTGESAVNLTNISIKDSAVAETSWMDDKAVFVNKTLEDITRELERKFNITVVFKNDGFRKQRYTLYLDSYELNEIMHVLQLTGKIDYELNGKQLIIK